MKNAGRISAIILPLLFAASLLQAQPGCPSVNAGPDMDVDCTNPCTDLTAVPFQTGTTDAYTVSSIPYAPPFPYNTGTPFSVGTDDVWTAAISLPFQFCFFGQNYSQVVVGSNGLLTFDVTQAGGYCPWQYTTTLPTTDNGSGQPFPTNAIFGVYQDIDPSICGDARYSIQGTAPCRMFIVSFDNVCYFDCNTFSISSMIVLYETTNVVEIYVEGRNICPGWNDGNGIIGMQNANGTVGYTPPGRNGGAWTSGNEAWRFTPSGAGNYTVSWYQGATLVGNGATVNVCPTATTTYTARAVYTHCDGTQVTVTDDITVNVTNGGNVTSGSNSPLCAGEDLQLNCSSGALSYTWTGPGGFSSTNEDPVIPAALPSASGVYRVIAEFAAGCTDTGFVTVVVNPLPNAAITSSGNFCEQQLSSFGAVTNGATYSWNGPGGFTSALQTIVLDPATTANNGTYTVTVTDNNQCSATSTFTADVHPSPTANFSADVLEGCSPVCTQFTDLSVPNGGAITAWHWYADGVHFSDETNPDFCFNGEGGYDIQLQVVSANGCVNMLTRYGYINVHQTPQAEFSVDELIPDMDPDIQPVDHSTNATTWLWDFGDGTTSTDNDPFHQYAPWDTGTYCIRLMVSNHGICFDTATHCVRVFLQPTVYIPNSFTPNLDGHNTFFTIYGRGFTRMEMYIFNRWGQQIFFTNSQASGWNGNSQSGSERLPEGVYAYRIYVEYLDDYWVYTGHVNLLR